jgi:hypothetical protein
MPQQPLVESREADSSSEPADTGDEGFQSSLLGSTEGSLSSTPADSDDGWNRSQSGNEEASSLSEDTEPDDEYHPAHLSPEDKRFMMLLGWKEDEIVQVAPLDFDEIADTVSHSFASLISQRSDVSVFPVVTGSFLPFPPPSLISIPILCRLKAVRNSRRSFSLWSPMKISRAFSSILSCSSTRVQGPKDNGNTRLAM